MKQGYLPATFVEHHSSLARFARYFNYPYKPPPLATSFEATQFCTGYTDGKAVFLPQYVQLGSKSVDEWVYVHIMVHELQHIKAGSFDFNFSTLGGRQLFKELRHRRPVFKNKLKQWDSARIINKWKAEGEVVVADKKCKLSHYNAFLMHFRHEQGAHGLFNLLEDVRIEAIIEIQYPGLTEIGNIINRYRERLQPDAASLMPEELFMRAMQERLIGKEIAFDIPIEYQIVWQLIGPILDTCKWHAEIASVYDSAKSTLSIIDILEDQLNAFNFNKVMEQLENNTMVPAEDMMLRRQISQQNSRFNIANIPKASDFYKDSLPDNNGPYQSCDEWDEELEVLQYGASWMRQLPWKPQRPSNLSTNSSANNEISNFFSYNSPTANNASSEGINISLELLHDYLVDWKSGQPADQRVFIDDPNCPSFSQDFQITFVIDLTVSMAYAPVGSVSLLLMALRLIEVTASTLDQEQVSFRILGMHDTGRKQITCHVVKDFANPFDPNLLHSIHTQGLGGYRIGAILRALSSQITGDTRHLIVCITDAASHYTESRPDNAFHQIATTCCATCDKLANCWAEPIDAREGVRSPEEHPKCAETRLFKSIEYEISDIQHAIASNVHVTPLIVLLNGHADNPWSQAFPEHCLNISSPQDPTQLLEVIKNLVNV